MYHTSLSWRHLPALNETEIFKFAIRVDSESEILKFKFKLSSCDRANRAYGQGLTFAKPAPRPGRQMRVGHCFIELPVSCSEGHES